VVASPATRWRDQRGFTLALVVAFGVLVVTSAVLAVAIGNRLAVVRDVRRGDFTDVVQRASDADDYVDGAAAVFGLTQIVIVVLFLVWLFRAAKNNEALERRDARFAPGWSIGAWFIPLANLVIPVLIVQDLWRGATPEIPRGDPRWRSARGSGLVAAWWVAWLLSLLRFIASSSRFQDDHTLEDIEVSNWIALFGVLASAVAAVLAVFVVRGLARRQLETLREQRRAYDARSGQLPGQGA
jgi:hypothetical protein